LCHIRRYALQKLRPVGEEHYRKTRSLRSESFEKPFGLGIIGGELNVNPLIRNMISRQKITQLI
jgi:hypothetical protein